MTPTQWYLFRDYDFNHPEKSEGLIVRVMRMKFKGEGKKRVNTLVFYFDGDHRCHKFDGIRYDRTQAVEWLLSVIRQYTGKAEQYRVVSDNIETPFFYFP